MTSNILEYNNIKQILGFTANISGETNNLYFYKEFRYSSDNILWSDYKQLTNENLTNIDIYDGKIYLQYRFTQIGNGNLTKKLTVKASKFSASAVEKIEAIGGKAEVI